MDWNMEWNMECINLAIEHLSVMNIWTPSKKGRGHLVGRGQNGKV